MYIDISLIPGPSKGIPNGWQKWCKIWKFKTAKQLLLLISINLKPLKTSTVIQLPNKNGYEFLCFPGLWTSKSATFPSRLGFSNLSRWHLHCPTSVEHDQPWNDEISRFGERLKWEIHENDGFLPKNTIENTYFEQHHSQTENMLLITPTFNLVQTRHLFQ